MTGAPCHNPSMPVTALAMLCHADAVRLVSLSGTTRNPDVTHVAEARPEADAAPEALAALAAHTALTAGLNADRILLGLPGETASLRRLRFPFTKQAKIDLVLGPEFEPHLSFPLNESALSWVRTSLEPPPATVALATAFPLPALTAMLGALADNLLPPTAACLDLAGLDAVLGRLEPKGTGLLIALDGRRASLVCRLDGRPAIWRTLPAVDGDPVSPEALAREALLTLSAVGAKPSAVYWSGETDVAVREALAQVLPLPVLPVAAQPGWPRLPDGAPLPDRYAAAYGLALLALTGPGPMNFLRGDLAPAIPPIVKRQGMLLAGSSIAALLAAAVLGLIFSYSRLDNAIAAAKAHTAALVAKAAPDASPGLTLTQKLSVLRGRLNEQDDLAKSRAAAAGSTLEILAAIHECLGTGERVRVSRISADDQHVSIDATADDYNTVDEVKRRLAAKPFFQDVEIKGAKNVPDKKQVEFQLDIRRGGQGKAAS